MPKFTKKEFAIACGIETKSLSNYIARGKVVVTDEKIDTDLQMNQYFLEQRREFNAKKNGKQPIPEQKVAAEQKLNDRVAEKNIKGIQAAFSFPKENAAPTRNYQLDEQIKEQSLEKEKINSALLRAKLDKISGDTIPTELVKTLIIHHSKSITIAFHNGAETILTRIAKLKGIDLDEMALLRTELIEIVNAAVKNSIDTSKKTVGQIVAEHSQKKEVGERE